MAHFLLASKWTQYQKLTTKVKKRSRISEGFTEGSSNNCQQPDFSEFVFVVDVWDRGPRDLKLQTVGDEYFLNEPGRGTEVQVSQGKESEGPSICLRITASLVWEWDQEGCPSTQKPMSNREDCFQRKKKISE